MRWTRQRRACVVMAGRVLPVSDRTACGRTALTRTAKSCGPDASTPASSPAEASRPNRARTKPYPLGDGDKKARSPGRARRKPLKPLACGNAGCSGATVATTLACYLHFAREAAGAAGTRHSPRPQGRMVVSKLGRLAPRDRVCVSEIGCLKIESARARERALPLPLCGRGRIA